MRPIYIYVWQCNVVLLSPIYIYNAFTGNVWRIYGEEKELSNPSHFIRPYCTNKPKKIQTIIKFSNNNPQIIKKLLPILNYILFLTLISNTK